MSDTPRLFPLSDQPAFIQLMVSAIVILFIGILFLVIFIFSGVLIFNVSLDHILMTGEGEVTGQGQIIFKYLQAVQTVSLFILPPLVISILMTNGRGNWLLLKNKPTFISILLVTCLAILLIPITSSAGLFNSGMELPSWLSGIESWMQEKEEIASYLTGVLIEAETIPVLLLNLFIIAVLPALGEEFLFRGVLQQIFQKMFRSGHFAVWITAIIFSSIHLQFYGFLPRLILGLVFGYLFYWGRSMWLPVTAHFINNAIPVVASYFLGWSQTNNKVEELAETSTFLILGAAVGCIVIMLYFWNNYNSLSKTYSRPLGGDVTE